MNAVYIMASRKHGTLYIGVTSELLRRAHQHREGMIEGSPSATASSASSGSNRTTASSPRSRETSLKRYRREWKINLIERANPNWDDLFPQFFIEKGPLSHLQPRERSM